MAENEIYKLPQQDAPVTQDDVRNIIGSMQRFQSGQQVMVDGIQRSQSYIPNVQGWQIDAEGNAEFNNGTFRGTFNIGGTVITIDNTEDIQTNIDAINTAGGGILYLQAGTYNLTASVSVPTGVALRGVVRDDVILDFGGGAYSVQSVGSNAYTTGTVTINDTETTVVGSGTTFTSGMVGRTIFLNDSYYEITAFTDTTHITISPAYSGTNLSGATYAIATPTTNVFVGSLTIQNSSSSGMKFQYNTNSFFDDSNVYDTAIGLDVDNSVGSFYTNLLLDSNTENLNFSYVYSWTIDGGFVNNATNNGITMSNGGNATFFNTGIDNCGADGMNLTNISNVSFISWTFSRNGGQGVEFVSGCNDNQLIGGASDGNTSDGIKFTATSDRNHVVAVTSKNNGGYGINIAAATCDDNVINSPSYSGNSSGTLSDSGTGTVVLVDDTAYGSSWNGNKGAPTKNAMYGQVELKAPLASPTFTGTVTTPAIKITTGAGSGKVLTSDADGDATWETPSSTSTPKMTMVTDFAASARYSLSGNTPTFGTSGVTVATTADVGNTSILDWSVAQGTTNGQIFGNSPAFSTNMFFTGLAASTGEIYVGLGRPTCAGAGHTFTDAHIGFKITTSGGVSSLYATQADGSTETASSALTTLASNDIIELVLQVNGSSSVDYYWRKNGSATSSATNLTTNMPSTSFAEGSCRWSATNNNTANTFTFRTSGGSFIR